MKGRKFEGKNLFGLCIKWPLRIFILQIFEVAGIYELAENTTVPLLILTKPPGVSELAVVSITVMVTLLKELPEEIL